MAYKQGFYEKLSATKPYWPDVLRGHAYADRKYYNGVKSLGGYHVLSGQGLKAWAERVALLLNRVARNA